MSSYTERMIERLQIIAGGSIVYSAGTAAATGTGGTADMADARRALFLMQGQGTGTANITVQVGSVTYGTNSDGVYTSGGVPTWAALTEGTATAGATGSATQGEHVVIEVRAESMPASARYLRALVANGSANTYATLITITDCERNKPVDDDDIDTYVIV